MKLDKKSMKKAARRARKSDRKVGRKVLLGLAVIAVIVIAVTRPSRSAFEDMFDRVKPATKD